jgi:hypothetical protein
MCKSLGKKTIVSCPVLNMNGGDDKKHLDTLGVLLVDFFMIFWGYGRPLEGTSEQGKRGNHGF